MWSYADMWQSSSYSHPRRGLGLMCEAAEDISCNIMPQPLPAPYNPPPPPCLLSSIQSTRRHERHETFLSATTIFFSSVGKKKKACRPCCCGQPCGCMRKETCGYRLHKWPAWMCESQTKYRIWAAAVAEKAFPAFVMFEHVHSADGWEKHPTLVLSGENALMTLVYSICIFLCCWGKRKKLCSTNVKAKSFMNINKLYQHKCQPYYNKHN